MENKQDIAKKENSLSKEEKQYYEAVPAVDIYENDDEILLHADMPGVTKDKIFVDIDNGTLAISGIRELVSRGTPAYEEFYDLKYVRNFSVPQSIDVGRVEAELKTAYSSSTCPNQRRQNPGRLR